MKVKSKIIRAEQIENTLKKNAALKKYYPLYVQNNDDTYEFALLTEHEVEVAINRGKNNPEDEVTPFKMRWWHKLLSFFLDI